RSLLRRPRTANENVPRWRWRLASVMVAVRTHPTIVNSQKALLNSSLDGFWDYQRNAVSKCQLLNDCARARLYRLHLPLSCRHVRAAGTAGDERGQECSNERSACEKSRKHDIESS